MALGKNVPNHIVNCQHSLFFFFISVKKYFSVLLLEIEEVHKLPSTDNLVFE